MKNSNYCILLTATLTPGNVPYLLRTDLSQRENDYVKAVRQWLSHGVSLIFVENSNTRSEKIIALLNQTDNNEYITFQSTESTLGKGNGEMEIIRYSLQHSKILPHIDTIIKVTGRHYITNLDPLLKCFAHQNAYVMGWFKEKLTLADSRLVIANKSFYTINLLPLSKCIDETNGIYFEHIFARAIHSAMAEGKCWCLPSEAPKFIGVSGSENLPYRNDIFRLLKRNTILTLMKVLLAFK